ncbi:MAG: hypothetical protein MRERV_3c071 [Mycoplasmataceae bacterium RV_VA103A]|nr:MAG: hypothetical protein MRERV_3c071 [Mycoplasmataceae bacterium RV_VA103A]
MKLLLIIPWIAAAAVAYYFLETIGCCLKKADPTLYNRVKNDMTTIDDLIQEREKARQEAKEEDEEAEKALKEETISENDESYKEAKAKVDKMLAEIKKNDEEIAWLKTVKEKGLDNIHWSVKNIAWTAGIFLVVGLALHYITKKIMSIFFTNKEN